MSLSRYVTSVISVAATALAFAACSGTSSTPPALRSTGALPAPAAHGAPLVVHVVDAAPPKVAGTYAGTLVETEGSHTMNGTVTIAIQQSGATISGTFDITFGTRTADLTLSGTVKAAKHGASLKFTIFNPHGRNAHAGATVIRSSLKGKAHVPASGSQPAVLITFTTTKQ